MTDLFDVEPDSMNRSALHNKARQASEKEVAAYMRALRERLGLGFSATGIHYDSEVKLNWCGNHYGGRNAGDAFCIGATFGKHLTQNGRDAGWQEGSFSLVMPGWNHRRQTVTMETLDEAGEVIATSTMPLEPKKGGVIWSKEAVRAAAGPMPKVAKAKRTKVAPIVAPVASAPIADVREEAPTCDAPGTDEQPPARFEYSRWRHGGWYVHNVRWPNGGCGCVSRNYADRKWRIACDRRPFEEQPTFSSRDEAALGEWHYVRTLPPVDPEPVREREETVEAIHAAPEPETALSEAVAAPEPEANTLPDTLPAMDDVLARLEALELQMAALEVTKPVTPTADACDVIPLRPDRRASVLARSRPVLVAQPKRTLAHARAIRRAWAERKGRRSADRHISIGMQQLTDAKAERDEFLGLFQTERDRAVELICERDALSRKRRRSTTLARHRGREMATLARMIAAERQASEGQRQRAAVAEAALAKLQRDLADPSQPERASDVAMLKRERDTARTALAAVEARFAGMKAANERAAEEIGALASRVAKAEAIVRRLAA